MLASSVVITLTMQYILHTQLHIYVYVTPLSIVRVLSSKLGLGGGGECTYDDTETGLKGGLGACFPRKF